MITESQIQHWLQGIRDYGQGDGYWIPTKQAFEELCQLALKGLRPEDGFGARWRDTKVTVPCEGDDVLCCWIMGAADKPMTEPLFGVATYARKGHWHEPEDDDDDYRTPEFWMPLPSAPQKQSE